MVNITATETISPAFAKRDRIIQVAIRRFGHFGFDKTTMTEIALDASISKQALSHYFSDKKLLVTAVIESVMGAYMHTIERAFTKSKNMSDTIDQLMDARRHLYQEHNMILSQLVDPQVMVWNKSLIESIKCLKEREMKLLRDQMIRSIESRELKPLDAEKTSVLLLDVLTSMMVHAFDWNSITDPNVGERLFAQQKELLMLIYKGMKA